jgi:succinate dehydrogenase / fumarate reductase flavoprotein subunit
VVLARDGIDGIESHPVDVLVIGAGGAGIRAAIEAKAAGASVGLVCKSLFGKAHTVMAEGGVAAALGHVDPEDKWETHFRDTMVGGKLLNNPRMAELHAKEAPDRVRELEAWGAVFDRTRDGRILQRPFGGHSHPRLAHVGDRTGLEMIRTLQDRAVAVGIDVFMECTITRLITGGGSAGATGQAVVGAFGYWRTTGAPVAFPAKAVVLATGGIGKAYTVTSNSWEYSGDGHALAYSVGADLIDMEFVQFHPTGMVWPPGVRGLLVTEAVRGEGGILRNNDGKRFMWDYLPEDRRGEYAATDEEAAKWVTAQSQGRVTDARRPPELSTRDNVSRAIYTEVREGRGSPHGGVFLDISYLPAEHVRRKLPSMYDQFKELADVDITKGPMEIAPTTHYVMGGVRVDAETGASTVAGLFAAGEVAGGMHGANRLGGNSLSDLLVFGARTGAGAAAHAAGISSQPYLDPVQVRQAGRELDAPLERGSSSGNAEDPYTLQHDLQDVMQRLVGIFRVERDLQDAIAELGRLKARWPAVAIGGGRTFNPGWNLVFELRNLLVVSEAITRSALQRTESRGAHSRIDYPDTDQAGWGARNSVVRRGPNGTMEVTTTTLPEMRDELRLLLGGAH